MISQSYWILIVVLSTGDGSAITNDVMMFDSKQACEETRDRYLGILNQYWFNTRSYISNCYRGAGK